MINLDVVTPKRKLNHLRLSIEQLNDLAPISKRIRDHWDTANLKAAMSRTNGNEAVKEALLCGHALLEAKDKLDHGQWLPWLAKHCADVSKSIVTAQNWMRLARANKQGVCFLEEANSLTAAYRLVGILPALPAPEHQEQKEMTIDALSGRLQWLRKVSSSVLAWPAEQKRRLAEELRPLVDFYHQLLPPAGLAPHPG